MEEIRNRLPAEIVTEIARRFDRKARVTSWEDEKEIHVDVWGEEVSLLIGRGGRTLDAIQELVTAIVKRREGERRRVTVDIERYRERKKKRLEEKAREAVERALSLKRPVSLLPMSASERKIVHNALKDDHRVKTKSEGEEPERKVIIYPESG